MVVCHGQKGPWHFPGEEAQLASVSRGDPSHRAVESPTERGEDGKTQAGLPRPALSGPQCICSKTEE